MADRRLTIDDRRIRTVALLVALILPGVASAAIHQDQLVSGGEPAATTSSRISWAAMGEPLGGRTSGGGFTILGGGFPPTASGPSVLVFQESGGQVVMEVENFDQHTPRNGKSWILETALSGYSGPGYMTALPNTGVNQDTGYVTKSPELIYRVKFSTTGTYYVWVRGYGASGNDDSIHAGLDGTGPSTANRISSFPASWTWSRSTMDGPVATLRITSAGIHTLHLWMREDGFRADKLLLRTDSSSTPPSGVGPLESPRKPNFSPQISALSPGEKSRFYQGAVVALAVTATDPDGDPLRYRFLVDGRVIRGWSSTATASWNTATAAFGWHTVRVEVTDRAQTAAKESRVFIFWRPPL